MVEMIEVGFYAIGASAIAYLTLKFGKNLSAELKKLETEATASTSFVERKALETAITVVENVTNAVVYKLEQTDAKELREKVKAGLESRESLLRLADEAYKEITEVIADNTLDVLGSAIGDIEEYIRALIEKNVLEAKATENANTK